MFWFLVQSGSLPKTHVFYEEVKAFTSKALGWLVPPTADFQSTYRSLTSWLQSNQFLHGKGATHFFNGIGGDGQGHLAEMAMSTEEGIKCHNFAGVSPRSLTTMNGPPHVTSGVKSQDVLNLFMLLRGTKSVHMKKHHMVGYLMVSASDAMAIKPGLQFAPQANGIIGLNSCPVLTIDKVMELKSMSEGLVSQFLKDSKFRTQALEVHLTSMDDTVSKPVAVFYCDSAGGWEFVSEINRQVQRVIEKCEECLKKGTEGSCVYKCEQCFRNKCLCEECKTKGHKEWNPIARPCEKCHQNNEVCYRLLPFGWSSDCESRQKAFMERLSGSFPETYQLPIPDPPHNLKSVRSAVFWYWLYLEEYLINVRILLVVRRDRNPNVSSAMKKAVSLKALKNKDRMSVETALEIFHPNVQRAIPAQDVIITLVPEIYTFWRQNRPGNILCPLDITIHKESGSIFFSDHTANQIMKCDLHSPSNVISIAGGKEPGNKDGQTCSFREPSGLCSFKTILFVCDSGNGSIRAVDFARLVTRSRNRVTLDVPCDEEQENEDNIPIERKITVTTTLALRSSSRHFLQRPFSICTGRKLLQEYPDLYVGDTKQQKVFKIDEVKLDSGSSGGRLHLVYPPKDTPTNILPVALAFQENKLYVASNLTSNPNILVIDSRNGTLLSSVASELIISPSGLCFLYGCLYVSNSSNHTIVKVSDIEHVPRYQLVAGSSNESGDMDGVVSSATLHSPHGLETFGRTLFVCDSGNKAIRMITNGKPFKKLSDVFYKYAELFNLDHYRGPPRFSFDQGISIIDNVVAFLLTWGEETRERTGRTATQGPDQIIPHCTRRSFQLIHSSLVKLKNLLTELGEEDLVNQILFSALTTLIVENFFSLMRQQDSMPTQLEYGIRRAACIRELEKRMHSGHFQYFTGPKSYYPNKVLNTPPPIPQAIVDAVQSDLQNLSLEEKKTLREFAISFGRSVRQHTVRDKSKEETGQLPYPISFSLQQRQDSSCDVLTEDLAAGHANSSSYSQDNRVIQCDILFKQNETIAVKHGRKKEEWGFFLAVLMKDLLIKKGSNDGIDFVDDCMSITWLDNCETGDKYTFKESYSDCRNSPYSVIDRVEVVVNEGLPNEKLYTISQQEVLRIERILKGGVDSDIDSEDEASDASDDEQPGGPSRVSCRTRTGRTATRIRLR